MIKAKKSLGQNFLIDNNVLEKIINSAPIENKNVIEIGPGTGKLTSFILKKKTKKINCSWKRQYSRKKLRKRI